MITPEGIRAALPLTEVQRADRWQETRPPRQFGGYIEFAATRRRFLVKQLENVPVRFARMVIQHQLRL